MVRRSDGMRGGCCWLFYNLSGKNPPDFACQTEAQRVCWFFYNYFSLYSQEKFYSSFIPYAQHGMYSANLEDTDVGSLRLIRPASSASRIKLETCVLVSNAFIAEVSHFFIICIHRHK